MAESRRRRTRQLDIVWEAIKGETSHPTADQIYQKVRRSTPRISLGTVYRNLQKLVAEKKLQVVTLERTQRFDPVVAEHQHFICEKCGRVYDIFVGGRGELIPSLPTEGFTVTSHQLSLYGTCLRCAQTESQSR